MQLIKGKQVRLNVADITDVTLTNPSTYDVLTYSGGTWVNSPSLGGDYLALSGGTVDGDVTINGNFYVSGVTTTIDVNNMNVSDNIMLLNSGEESSSVTLGTAGLEIDRGTSTNYQIVFDETDDKLKAGMVGSLLEVTTFDSSGNLVITSANLRFNDTNTEIWEDGSGNLTFKDAITGTVTLSGLTTVSSIEIAEDSGAVNGVIDMSVSSTPTVGTEESYSFDLDGNNILKIYSEATGTGDIQNTGVVIEAEYQYFGDPSTDGSWRLFTNDDNHLVVEKRVSGSWEASGIFT